MLMIALPITVMAAVGSLFWGIDGLKKGVISYSLTNYDLIVPITVAKSSFARKDNPFFYWACIFIAFSFFIIFLVAALIECIVLFSKGWHN